MSFSIYRVRTIILRYYLSHKRNLSSLVEFFYFPIIDILMIGYIGVWGSQNQHPSMVIALLASFMLWQVVFRSNIEISGNLVVEMRDKNLINLFATPLNLSEWICSLLILGVCNVFVLIPYASALIKLAFGYSMASLGFILLPFIALLTMSGWILGLIGAGIIMYYGPHMMMIMYAVCYLPAPFCGAYYPTHLLPYWMQVIGKCLPMTYALEGMRLAITTGTIPYPDICVSFMLNILYFALALFFFKHMFNKSKKFGFAH